MASGETNRVTLRLSLEALRQLDELQVEISPIKSAVVRAVLLKYLAKDGREDIRLLIDDSLSDVQMDAVIRKELLHLHDDGLNRISFSEVLKTLELQSVVVPAPAITLPGVIIPEKKLKIGTLVVAHTMALSALIRQLGEDWRVAYELSSAKWEEIVAGAFDLAGFDEVILTPRSGDHGRDVIAFKRGVGSIKIISSVKAYKPGLLVNYDDVRALIGVMTGEADTSKGIIATTSDFPPNVEKDPFIRPFLPTRLELLNGRGLNTWLSSLIDKPISKL